MKLPVGIFTNCIGLTPSWLVVHAPNVSFPEAFAQAALAVTASI